MKLPERIFGIDTDEARRKFEEESKKPKKQRATPKTPFADKEGFIYVPSINLYVAKEKSLHRKNWHETHAELHSQNLYMPTIPEFIEFLKHLRSQPNNEEYQSIYRNGNRYIGDCRGQFR